MRQCMKWGLGWNYYCFETTVYSVYRQEHSHSLDVLGLEREVQSSIFIHVHVFHFCMVVMVAMLTFVAVVVGIMPSLVPSSRMK